MDQYDDEACEEMSWWMQHAVKNPFWILCTYLLLWIIGILGNLITVVVFNHERMTKSYIISVLYWLTVCDFLKLVSFFVLAFLENFDFLQTGNLFFELISGAKFGVDDHKFLGRPESYTIILLFTLHNISIILNITLAFLQDSLIVYPFQYEREFSGHRSTKWAVNGVFFLCIIVSSLFLISSLHHHHPLKVTMMFDQSWNVYLAESDHGDISNANEVINSTYLYKDAKNRKDGILEELSYINITMGEDSRRRTKLTYILFGSWDNPAYISILSSVILRIGFLVVLIMASVGLIFGTIRAHCIQCNSQGPISQIPDRTVRNRMAYMILLVVFIFSITEIPVVMYSSLMLPYNILYIQCLPYYERLLIFGRSSTFSRICLNTLLRTVTGLMLVSLLFSSSYTVFCYLIMSAQYREILKHILCERFRSLKNFFSSNTQLTETVMVTYHRNLASNSP